MQWPQEANTAYSSDWVRNFNPKNKTTLYCLKDMVTESKETGASLNIFLFCGKIT